MPKRQQPTVQLAPMHVPTMHPVTQPEHQQLAWANPTVALLNILMAVTATYGTGCWDAFIMKYQCGSAALRSMVTNMVDLLDNGSRIITRGVRGRPKASGKTMSSINTKDIHFVLKDIARGVIDITSAFVYRAKPRSDHESIHSTASNAQKGSNGSSTLPCFVMCERSCC